MSRKLQVQLLNDKAKLPSKGTNKSAGWDLYLPSSFENVEFPSWNNYDGTQAIWDNQINLLSGEHVIIPLGIAFKFPEGTFGHVEPRSSCYFKRNLLVMGEIDEDYTGEVRLKFTNIGKTPQTIHAGERLAQMILLDYNPDVEVELVEDISRESERGDGAYGSTGR